MATNRTQLLVEVVTDATKATQGLNKVAGDFTKFGQKLGDGLKAGLGAAAAGLAVKSVIGAASDLQQSMGAVDAVFKGNAAQVHAWAADTSDSIRLPQAAFEQLAAVIGSQLKNAGIEDFADKTHDLIGLGADLAAQFGGSTADAVSALSSVLKGETDPIERYGVALNDAAIDAEALSIAQATGADAASKATRTQAALNIVYTQSADALGAAARESQSFAGRMEAFNEKFTNLQAAVGGPLLDAAGGFLDFLAGMLTTIQPLITGIASLVGSIGKLPPQLLLAASAFAAFKIFDLGKTFSAWGTAALDFAGKLKTAGTSTTGFASAMKGIGAAIGPGAAFAGATIVFTQILSFLQKLSENAAIAEAALQPVEDMITASGGHWTAAARDTQRAVLQQTDAFKQLTNAGADTSTALRILMGDAELWSQAQTGVLAGFDARKLTDITSVDKILEQSNALEGNAQGRIAAAEASGMLIDATGQLVTAQQAEQTAVEQSTKALEEAREAAQKYGEELLGAYQKQSKALSASTTGQTILDRIAADAEKATRAGQLVTAMLDDVRGSMDTGTAEVGLIKNLQSLAELGKGDTAGDVKRIVTSIEDLNAVKLVGQGAVGGEIADLFSSMRTNLDNYIGGMVAAGESVETIQFRTSEELIRMQQTLIDSLGIPPEKAAEIVQDITGLTSGADIDPVKIDVILDDFEAKRTEAYWATVELNPVTLLFESPLPEAQPIVDALNKDLARAHPAVVPTEAGTPNPAKVDSWKAATELGIGVKIPTYVAPPAPGSFGALITSEQGKLTGGGGTPGGVPIPVKPTIDQTAMTGVKDAIAGIKPQPVPITLTGDAVPVNNTIRSVVGGTYTAIVHLGGDQVPVNNVIRSVIGGSYTAIIRLDGDSFPVNSDIRAVIGGSYPPVTISIDGNTVPVNADIRAVIGTDMPDLVVNIVGNRSGLDQVLNSIPTTRTITILTQGAAAGPAGGGATPTLMSAIPGARAGVGGLVSTAGPTSGNTIIVQAALDPVGTARTIDRMLRKNDRRSGSVVVNGNRHGSANLP